MSKKFAQINSDTKTILTIIVADDINYLIENFGGEWVEIKENHTKPLQSGYIWDANIDNFYKPQPYPSFILNKETAIWEPPIKRPNDNILRVWSEEYQRWTPIKPIPFRSGEEPSLSSEKQDDEFVYEYNFNKKLWEAIDYSYDSDTDTWIKFVL